MDYLWTPWRYKYMEDASKNVACVFCHALSLQDDRAAQIVLRGEKNFVILNRYPYTTGHVMVVPYVHGDTLTGFDSDTLAEMMILERGSPISSARSAESSADWIIASRVTSRAPTGWLERAFSSMR